MRGLFFVLVLCCAAGVLRVAAQDFARLSEAERKQVNDWLAERAETMSRAHDLEREIRQAWGDTKYSSAEVDALRKRYRELQQELTQTQYELQKKVQDVPAAREVARQLEEAKKKEQELAKKIREKAGEKR
jgi:septal ring factor EnvC (AmiA/AmiB activator)